MRRSTGRGPFSPSTNLFGFTTPNAPLSTNSPLCRAIWSSSITRATPLWTSWAAMASHSFCVARTTACGRGLGTNSSGSLLSSASRRWSLTCPAQKSTAFREAPKPTGGSPGSTCFQDSHLAFSTTSPTYDTDKSAILLDQGKTGHLKTSWLRPSPCAKQTASTLRRSSTSFCNGFVVTPIRVVKRRLLFSPSTKSPHQAWAVRDCRLAFLSLLTEGLGATSSWFDPTRSLLFERKALIASPHSSGKGKGKGSPLDPLTSPLLPAGE